MKSIIILIFYWFSFSWIVSPLFRLVGSHHTLSTFSANGEEGLLLFGLYQSCAHKGRKIIPPPFFVCVYVVVWLCSSEKKAARLSINKSWPGAGGIVGTLCWHSMQFFLSSRSPCSIPHSKKRYLTPTLFSSLCCCGCWHGLLVHGSRCTNSFASGKLISLAKHWSVRCASPSPCLHTRILSNLPM